VFDTSSFFIILRIICDAHIAMLDSNLGHTYPWRSNDDDEEELLHHEIASLCQSKAIER
jgi:hypothetical protein